MTPLEAARALVAALPGDNHNGECVFCEGPFLCAGDDEWQWWLEHRPDCLWLAMPQIVTALEAAQRILPWLVDDDSGEERCVECCGIAPGSCYPDICSTAAFRAVLRGEPA